MLAEPREGDQPMGGSGACGDDDDDCAPWVPWEDWLLDFWVWEDPPLGRPHLIKRQ